MSSLSTRVLVVEDEPAIQELLQMTLEQAGFKPVIAGTAEQAWQIIRNELPDLALVDWMLPGLSGLALTRQLRADARTRSLPLVLLTARGEENDRVMGLEGGADDYITKPFSPRELVARLRAVLRRRAPQCAGEPLEHAGVRLDPETHTVTVDACSCELAATEFRLLRYLLAHPGRVFSRAQLLDSVWGDHQFVEERTVDVSVRRLRLALGERGDTLIETVRGVGYRLSLKGR